MAVITVDGVMKEPLFSRPAKVLNNSISANSGGQTTLNVARGVLETSRQRPPLAFVSVGNGRMIAKGADPKDVSRSNDAQRIDRIVPGPIANLEYGQQIGEANVYKGVARAYPPILVNRSSS